MATAPADVLALRTGRGAGAAGYSRGYKVEGRGAWSRWICEREGCGETSTKRGDRHDDLAAWEAAGHQQEAHREALIADAAAALQDAREALRLSPNLVTDVDTHTYRGGACVTPEAATDALGVWKDQLTTMPVDRVQPTADGLIPAAEQRDACSVRVLGSRYSGAVTGRR
ncbi:hypothetical protein [Streptomyces acidicola]|uniref:hypothetical protein n=1 Tax=Streptomyces acidicola TaxID=2596892 RepID=UPI003814677F